MTPEDQSSVVDRVLADPARVHVELGNPDGGVWRTDRDCYELIASRCNDQSRTLETGLGISTALFVHLRTWHTCIAPWPTEVEHFRAYCRERGLDTDRLTLLNGFSDDELPSLPWTDLDLMLVDGGHGFPTPIIDWYYGASRLRAGGILILDDVHLPAVRLLIGYLDADPRWSQHTITTKWVAYERQDQGPLREEHDRQTFWAFQKA